MLRERADAMNKSPAINNLRHPYYRQAFVFCLAAFVFVSAYAQCANPVYTYFSRLFDETRAEKAIGEMMLSQIIHESRGSFKISKNQPLTERAAIFAKNAGSGLEFKVYVIESAILDEIPLPGGHIILTSGLLSKASEQEQQDFILARNVMQIVLKHPMKLIKAENLYPTILNQLKLKSEKRDQSKLHAAIKDYLRNIDKMNHKRADVMGIMLTKSPDSTRKAAVALMKSFSSPIWPVLPWDTDDMPSRVSELENLKLPE